MRTSKLHFDSAEQRLWVTCPKLATKINRILKKYDNGSYTFKLGEEAYFGPESLGSQMQYKAITDAIPALKSIFTGKAA